MSVGRHDTKPGTGKMYKTTIEYALFYHEPGVTLSGKLFL
jgi:hypothetical protein